MRTLDVALEIAGVLTPVGRISGNDASDARFSYLPSYCGKPSAAPISLGLPLQEEPFSPARTAAFFEGLLPEGFTRRSVSQWMQVDEGDYLSILHGLGRECLGAICITEGDAVPAATYERITEGKIRELAAEGASKSTELIMKAHLSLTGASGKVGLYHSADEDAWYLPGGTAPSTHIVKQSHIRLGGIVTNEQLSLMCAKRCGIEIPESFIIDTGNSAEHEVLFATARFDRRIPEDAELVSGLPKPLRLHQEDFAQALGLPASRKYERGGEGYLKAMFELLRVHSAEPVQDQLKLWDIIVFDWLIGNTDAHLKNFSLIYAGDLQTVRLAPAYDIVSTVVYEQSTHDMAFGIGGVRAIEDIDEGAWASAAKEAGLGEAMALARVRRMAERFPDALEASAAELEIAGFHQAQQLKERILASGGIRYAGDVVH